MPLFEFAESIINSYDWNYHHLIDFISAASLYGDVSTLTYIIQLSLSLLAASILWDITPQVLFGYTMAKDRDTFTYKNPCTKKKPCADCSDNTNLSLQKCEKVKNSRLKVHVQLALLITALQFIVSGLIFAITLSMTTPYDPQYSIDFIKSTKTGEGPADFVKPEKFCFFCKIGNYP